MTNLNYNIWLQAALGAGANVKHIFSTFESAEEIYRSTDDELRISGVFRERQIGKLRSTNIENSYRVIEMCGAMGIDIVTPDSACYPEQLLEIENFPLVLYVQGDISCLRSGIPFGIVGTRSPVQPGSLYATKALSGALSVSGFTIVSGGALGIDSAAHSAAMAAGGKTVAVLGGGIGANYLRTNEALRCAVAQHGALVSEIPPKTEPRKGAFPIRNRIIAALSVGVAVMEGGKQSGSLITAERAYSYGRDVFVLPCDAPTTSNQGVYELMQDGAKPIRCAMDVFEEYLPKFPEKVIVDKSIDLFRDIRNPDNRFLQSTADFEKVCKENLYKQRSATKRKKRKLADPLSEQACRVYDCFGDDPLSINDIAEAVFMPTSSVLGALTELEIFGYIELLPDTKYILKWEG